jgi:transposase-like protein
MRHAQFVGGAVRGPGMTNIARKSDGRRIFTDDFKRKQIGRVWRGELTVAELGRRLGIARSLLQRWKRLLPNGANGANGASAARTRSTPANEQRSSQYIRELQMLVGRQTAELELLRAELDTLKESRRSRTLAKR